MTPSQKRKKGARNQYKSKLYILKRINVYGVIEEERVYNVPIAKWATDLFDARYVDIDGETKNAGWDIITMPELDNFPIYLIQVKSNQVPAGSYLLALSQFKVPTFVKKQLHIWEDGKKEPIVIDL